MAKGKKLHKLMEAYCCISYLSDYTYTRLCAGQNCGMDCIQCHYNHMLTLNVFYELLDCIIVL